MAANFLSNLALIIVLTIHFFSLSYSQEIKADSTVFIIDAHIHNGFTSDDDKINLSNFHYFTERNVDAFCFPLPVDRKKHDDVLGQIKKEINYINKHSDSHFQKINFIASPDKFLSHKTNVLFSIEYFHGVFGNNVNSVRTYRNLGIRMISLIDSKNEILFEGNKLNSFCKSIIKEMNTCGIVVDITHLNEAQKLEVINFSQNPVVASHSCSRTISNDKFNLSDDLLKALREKNGYVFVTFNKNDIYKDDLSSNAISQFVKHLNHIKNFISIENIGIGSDYQAEGKYVPDELNEKRTYLNIIKKLETIGYSKEDIRKVMYANFLKLISLN